MDTPVDVLVVGAGPTVLTLACELLRHGLSVRVVDPLAEPSPWSKAITVHARTLEVLRQVGCADALVARGHKVHGATLWSSGQALARIDFDELETDFNYVLDVSQAVTEAELHAVLAQRGGRVERGARLTRLRQDGSGVTATLAVGEETVRARASWLVGCDGAHSVVRKALGLAFEGSTYEERFLLADVKVAWDTRDDRISTWFAEDGLAACFPMREGRWRLVLTDASDSAVDPTLDEVRALFDRRTGAQATLTDMVWSARFKIHCRQVQAYRDDRVFVAGDAAHIHSPAGGQGMNTGIQDAHNLAWKLAEVHRGEARGRLLDTYHAERHAVGQSVLRGTDAATRVGTVKGAAARFARDELARFLTSLEVVQQRIGRQLSELSVAYEGSALSATHETGLLQARVGLASGAETPNVPSVRAFELAPHAGQRARDGRITVAGEPGTRRLFDVLDTRRWNVLLFDGRSDSAEGYARMASLAAAVKDAHPDAVDAWVVTPRATRPAALPDGVRVLLDPDGELEARYGAATECMYALRPDLYVGFRAQPIDEAKALAYLAAWLR